METPDAARVDQLFRDLLDRPPDEQKSILDRECADSPHVRAEVEALLGIDGALGDTLAAPDETVGEPGSTEFPLESIDRYRVLSVLGEGGMGTVYLASQTEPIQRQVALKLIKPGMDTKRVVARFELERQALALMDHPHIAKVLDAGATELGRPYFVMELVKGVPITEYCRQNRLGVHARLRLVSQVCDAVQHAHQKGILHRDLKPSNILITLGDDGPVPKVIDFGIAKAVQPITDEAAITEVSQFIGTPEYMSPEQAHMNGLDIDTRTDIYSLGTLLYELLTGTLPFDGEKLRTRPLDEVLRVIREVEPPRPSSRLTTRAGSASTTAAERNTIPKTLRGLLLGDLDWIVMKSLDKDRTRRYDTAADMRRDLDRFLANQPISARPPTAAYVFRKFARRNKGSLAGSVIVCLALLGGSIALWRTNRANQEAVVAREDAEVISDLIRSAILAVGPEKLGREARMTDFLHWVTENFDKEFAGSPAARARLQGTIGMAYRRLNESDLAEFHLKEGLTLQRQVDPTHRLVAEFINELAILCRRLGRIDEAEALYLEALEHSREHQGEESLGVLFMTSNLGVLYRRQGDYTKAQQYLQEALDLRLAHWGPEDSRTIRTTLELASTYADLDRNDEAERLLRASVALLREKQGDENGMTLNALTHLGGFLMHSHRYAEALEVHQNSLAPTRKFHGEKSLEVGTLLDQIGLTHRSMNQLGLAEAHYLESLEVVKAATSDTHPKYLRGQANLAGLLRLKGEYERSRELYERVLRIRTERRGPDDRWTIATTKGLSMVNAAEGRTADAIRLRERVLAWQRERFAPHSPDVLSSLLALARHERAASKLEASLQRLTEALDQVTPPGKASDKGPYRAATHLELGKTLTQLGRFEDAKRHLETAHADFEQQKSADPLEQARAGLVALYEAWGKAKEASEWKSNKDKTRSEPATAAQDAKPGT